MFMIMRYTDYVSGDSDNNDDCDADNDHDRMQHLGLFYSLYFFFKLRSNVSFKWKTIQNSE